jgi:CBS domain-containing protein
MAVAGRRIGEGSQGMGEAYYTVLAREIMTDRVISVPPELPVDRIARLLTEHRITGVPVVNEDGRVIGIVTEFDLIAKRGKVARDIMSGQVISVSEETPAELVARLLTERRVKRVPVLRDGRLVGIISRADLVRLFALTRWACEDCGYFVRGFERPEECVACGSTRIVLDREPPGM